MNAKTREPLAKVQVARLLAQVAERDAEIARLREQIAAMKAGDEAMTHETIGRKLEDARVRTRRMGADQIAAKGLEPIFSQMATALDAYRDGWLAAGGSEERLAAREMGDNYAAQINDLLFRCGMID